MTTTPTRDSLLGGPGNDTLTGGSGNDIIFGGDGTDALTEQADGDMVLTDTSLAGPPRPGPGVSWPRSSRRC